MEASRKRCEDRISSLPDELLHYIFSFINTRHVVKTCILSKRWRSLWISVPYLHFYHDYRRNSTDFINLIYNALFCRDHQSSIQTFRLTHWDTDDPIGSDENEIEFIFECISIAVKDNVQELNLKLLASIHLPEIELPQCLLNSKSLVKLNLDIVYDGKYFDKVLVSLPESVNLPSLKLLKLKRFEFCGTDFIQQLLLNCPVLDTISIINCGYHTDILSIYATQLKHLEISWDWFLWDKCKMSISAPMLKSFRCACPISYEYFLEDLSSLDRADMNMVLGWQTGDAENFVWHSRNMMKVLGGLCNVKSLVLSAWLLEVLPRADELLPMSFCARHLKVTIWLSKYCMQSIKYLLENSYNLETLEVEITREPNERNIERWEYQEAAEVLCKCISFHKLNFVEIRNVEGYVNEVKLIKLMLENAEALKKLKFRASKEHSRTTKIEVNNTDRSSLSHKV